MTPREAAARTAALVVTFNRAAFLRDALAALHAQTVRPLRIVVVDNASTDDGATEAVLQEAEAAGADVVRLAQNTGASGGFAHGIAHAARVEGAEWVWMMDDDVVPEPDALERLFASRLFDDPATVALHPLEQRTDGKRQPRPVGHYSVVRAAYVGEPLPPGGGPAEVTYASFLGLLVRADVARRELPRADFFIWHDDVEYSQRLRRHGRLYLVPDAVVAHRTAETGSAYVRKRGRWITHAGTWRVYYGLRNRLLTLRAHARSEAEYAAGVAWLTFELVRSLASTFVHYEGDRLRLRLLVLGYLDGLRGRSGKRVEPGTGRYLGAPATTRSKISS